MSNSCIGDSKNPPKNLGRTKGASPRSTSKAKKHPLSGKSNRGLSKGGLSPKGPIGAKRALSGQFLLFPRGCGVQRNWSRSAPKRPRPALKWHQFAPKRPDFPGRISPRFSLKIWGISQESAKGAGGKGARVINCHNFFFTPDRETRRIDHATTEDTAERKMRICDPGPLYAGPLSALLTLAKAPFRQAGYVFSCLLFFFLRGPSVVITTTLAQAAAGGNRKPSSSQPRSSRLAPFQQVV